MPSRYWQYREGRIGKKHRGSSLAGTHTASVLRSPFIGSGEAYVAALTELPTECGHVNHLQTDGLEEIRPKQALFSDHNPVVSSHRRTVFLPSRLLCGVGPLPQL